MPRPAWAIQAGVIYHVLNRGNGRMRLFDKPADYAAFERVLAEGLERYPVPPQTPPPSPTSFLPPALLCALAIFA